MLASTLRRTQRSKRVTYYALHLAYRGDENSQAPQEVVASSTDGTHGEDSIDERFVESYDKLFNEQSET